MTRRQSTPAPALASSEALTSTQMHELFVNSWLDATIEDGAPTDRVTRLFLAALRAICLRSRASLGDVTLAAIFNRVLENLQRDHTLLTRLNLRLTMGSVVEMDLDAANRAHTSELVIAMRALILELLIVVGRLTAETLTNAVHAELKAIDVSAPT